MEKKKPSKNSPQKQVSREERQKQALKANLARRKAQARARGGQEAADKG